MLHSKVGSGTTTYRVKFHQVGTGKGRMTLSVPHGTREVVSERPSSAQLHQTQVKAEETMNKAYNKIR